MRVTIKDCEVQTFRAGGKGGQNQDKRDTGVRIIHRPSGAVGECREERKQLQNKRIAFERMANTEAFQQWAKRQVVDEVDEQVQSDERVRTYNFAKGYVKDHRTGNKSYEIDAIIDGDLDLIR